MANQAFGWSTILLGLLVGLFLGLRFHREEWLGGYASLRRRLIRLAHISLIALGILNVLFSLSGERLRLGPGTINVAAWAMMIGGGSMPICCLLAAWRPGWRQLFAVPVLSLLLGTALVVVGVIRP